MNEAVDATSADGDKQLGLTPEEARVMMSDPHSPAGKDNQQGFGNSPGGGLGSHPCFDALINHPGYISHVKEFVNGEQTAFTAGGSVMQRWPGQASGIHGGGDRLPDWFTWDEEQDSFLCRAVNVVVALNDCGVHGGNTCVDDAAISPTWPIRSKMTTKATRKSCGTATRTSRGGTASSCGKGAIWTACRAPSRSRWRPATL